jgi:hypothetical protein
MLSPVRRAIASSLAARGARRRSSSWARWIAAICRCATGGTRMVRASDSASSSERLIHHRA